MLQLVDYCNFILIVTLTLTLYYLHIATGLKKIPTPAGRHGGPVCASKRQSQEGVIWGVAMGSSISAADAKGFRGTSSVKTQDKNVSLIQPSSHAHETRL